MHNVIFFKEAFVSFEFIYKFRLVAKLNQYFLFTWGVRESAIVGSRYMGMCVCVAELSEKSNEKRIMD